MAEIAMQNYLNLIPTVKQSPKGYLWSSYDSEADVLYVILSIILYLILYLNNSLER